MSSIKTTAAGVCAIIAALAGACSALFDGNPSTSPDWASVGAAIMAGIGLISARDNSVSSEQAGAK